jgi:putative ABC transport system ATP-binding protein
MQPEATGIIGVAMAQPLFELDDVTLTRGGEPVLRQVSATLPEGASCVAGPSGAGKSTLLRLLNRLADPDSGSVAYRGRDVREYDVLTLRRDVCLVPQLPALLDGSVAENVGFGARLAGRAADVERALDLVGLDASFANRDASRLSVGEQQRVMLARAIVLEPSVLLLDEPTSALDKDARASVESTLVDLRRRLGLSFVLVTHDMDQAARMAGWVVRLDHGCVLAQGPIEEPAYR